MAQEIDPAGIPPGTRIHAYEVVSRLGQGGMGAVYKVVRDGKPYALKLAVQRNSDLSPEQRAIADGRTRREVATLAAITHPNVVQIRAFDRWPDGEDGYLYLDTDLVEGDRLYTWQHKHKPSLRNICGVFLHIADALYELHRHEVFHRDLKSENVLIRTDGEPIIIDFGIARQRSASTLTSAGTIVGTSTHLSPDFCRFVTTLQGAKGERYTYRPTDDLHAVGYMLYELLTGKPPFELVDDNEWDLLLDIANKQPPRPRELNPALPEVLDVLVMRLLAKNGPERFDTAKALADALTTTLESAGEDWDKPFLPPGPRQGPAFDVRGRRSREHLSGDELASLMFQEDSSGARHARPPTPPTRPVSALPAQPLQAKPNAPAPEPAAGPAFAPPTVERPSFQAPLVAEPSPPKSAAEAPSLPTAIRAVGAQFAAPQRRPSRAMVGAVLGGAAAMGLAALALVSGRAADDSRPRSLLASYENARKDAAAAPAPKPEPAPETTTPPPEPTSNAEPAAATPAAATAASAAPASPPLPAVVPAKAQGPRPPVRISKAAEPAPRATEVANAPAPANSWIKTAQSIEEPKATAPAHAAKLGVPFGAHIRVKLRSTLDSRSPSDALVEAVLPRPFLLRGEPLLPSRTMAYGTVQVSGGRFSIHFTKLRLPDDRELALNGTAVDTSDGKPGIAPSRRIGPAPSGSDDAASAVVRTSANLLLGKVGGDTVSDVASAAGQTALNHRGASSGGTEQALLVDPGADFEIVVKEAF